MPVIAPTPVAALPAPPLPTDTAPDFNAKAFASLGAYPAMVTQINSIGANVYNSATEAVSAVPIASSAAIAATVAANLAAGASNFRGNWSALTGAQTKGISVKYAGTIWYLAEDVANIAAWTPAVGSAKWIAVGGGPTPAVALAGGSTIDLNTADHFTDTVSASRTLAVANALSNSSFVLEISYTAGTITMPSGTVWPYATAPVFTSGKRYLIYFQRAQIGTAGWYASVLAEYAA